MYFWCGTGYRELRLPTSCDSKLFNFRYKYIALLKCRSMVEYTEFYIGEIRGKQYNGLCNGLDDRD